MKRVALIRLGSLIEPFGSKRPREIAKSEKLRRPPRGESLRGESERNDARVQTLNDSVIGINFAHVVECQIKIIFLQPTTRTPLFQAYLASERSDPVRLVPRLQAHGGGVP